jgi:heptosyltransferase I
VEESYASIPGWHPAVRDVIPVAMRGWRRAPWINHLPAIRRCIRHLRREHYDIVIDAQGLLKSAVLARLARGRRAGYGKHGIREPAASRLYDETVDIDAGLHAVDRARALFAGALHYTVPATLDYGLQLPPPPTGDGPEREPVDYLVFIPGTTWPSKHWPEAYWRALTILATDAGWRVRINFGSDAERSAAERIAAGIPNVELPRLSIESLAHVLRDARAVVSVDSGPGHLAAAVGTPGVSIYGATDPALMGTRGAGQMHLRADFPCSPCLRRRCKFTDRGGIYPDCYASVPPERVWSTLRDLIQER